MIYDNTCKFIAETFPTDIATWLLGEPITLTKLEPSELSVEPIRADSLIFLQSEDTILHAEFQTEGNANIPFRMADYRLRAYRRYPHKNMCQVVVYLKPSTSELVYQDNFTINNLRSNFEVIRLWEQPTELFLASPGLFPFAVLSQTLHPDQVIRQIAQQIQSLTNQQEQSNIAASTAILAGLVLNRELIHSVLRREIMRESVIYQEIRDEGIQQGVQQGVQQEAVSFVRRLLKRRLGDINPQLEAQVEMLSVEQLEALGEALLDFNSEENLMTWLQENTGH